MGHISFPSFPDLPVATYTGDSFGNAGPGGRRIPVDAEGLALNPNGSFWVSDEYGPYIYRYVLLFLIGRLGADLAHRLSAAGLLIAAIRLVDAIIPMRNVTEFFSADSPPFYDNKGADDDVFPADNPTGRDNNSGFEGLTSHRRWQHPVCSHANSAQPRRGHQQAD
jgi:hypothetical protein